MLHSAQLCYLDFHFFFFYHRQSCSLEICLPALRGTSNWLRTAHYVRNSTGLTPLTDNLRHRSIFTKRFVFLCKEQELRVKFQNFTSNILPPLVSEITDELQHVFISLCFSFFSSSNSMFWPWAAQCSTPCFMANWLRTRMKSIFQMWNRQRFWQC